LEKWSYRSASVVSGICHGMLEAFRSKRVPEEKIYLFPNWIPDSSKPKTAAHGASFRAANGISATTPLIAYSGNVGIKQGLEVVVEAAALAEKSGTSNVKWAICGEGAAKPKLEEQMRSRGVATVSLFPLQPDDLYASLLREADISLITQQKGTGQFFFPSKLLSILQYGRPVLAVADESSELARAVRDGNFGLVVAPGDAAALVAAAQTMLASDDAQRAAWAQNGRAWVDQFRRTSVLSAFEKRLLQLVGLPKTQPAVQPA
jgi:colanic acid biosynthesis glycosyl transferase WcaI